VGLQPGAESWTKAYVAIGGDSFSVARTWSLDSLFAASDQPTREEFADEVASCCGLAFDAET
jgi:hypothetical protein